MLTSKTVTWISQGRWFQRGDREDCKANYDHNREVTMKTVKPTMTTIGDNEDCKANYDNNREVTVKTVKPTMTTIER